MTDVDTGLLAKLITDHVSDGMMLTDANGKVIWINPAFTRISGYDLKDMKGKRPGEILQGERTSSESRKKIAKAIAAKAHCKVDIVNYAKTGDEFISEINLEPVFDQNGELTHFVAIVRDVTSQRRLAQVSIDFMAYKQALDQQAIISVTDARGKITYANSKFSDISGYSNEELIGKNHRILNSGTHEPSFFRDMWRTIRTGQNWHEDVCNVSKSGDIYWVDTTIVPVHGLAGEIVSYVSIRYEITDRKTTEQVLRRMAETDALTGLSNRAHFAQVLKQTTASLKRRTEEEGVFLFLLDIDHFKELNDSFGHHIGDLLLKEISLRLKTYVDSDCVVARMGGDEFAALIPSEAVVADPRGYARMLHASICEPLPLADIIYMPSISIGVTRYPEDAQTVDGLMMNASYALDEAKRNGLSQVCLFDSTILKKQKNRNHFKTILEAAIDHERFEIVMQPIYSMQKMEHYGFEVLVRLSNNGKPVSPDDFIPLAEEMGLIGSIGQIVRKKAMMARRRILDQGIDPKKISINVSSQELCDDMLIDDLKNMLIDNDMSPAELIVEVTETAMIGPSKWIVASALKQLKEIGVQIALDDFGTGFSSISHLREFPIDTIKIDKTFVRDLEHDEGNRAVVEGLIFLARRLGLDAIAEGVENPEQRECLRQLKCDHLQGFHHSKPLSVEHAIKFLKPKNARVNE